MKFKKGDIVRKRTGKSPIVVNSTFGIFFNGYYLKSRSKVSNACMQNYVLFEEQPTTEGESKMDNTLYQIKTIGDDLYGHKLAVNSAGKWVMEVKGTGAILTVDAADCSEVTPYTVAVRFSGNNSGAYDFLSTEGKFRVGDIVIRTDAGYEGSIGRVVKLDTKSKKATKEFVGRRVVTEEV